MLYLYALASEATDLFDLSGVQGEALESFPAAGAIAIAGRIEALPPLTAAMLAAQDRVVRSLHARADALLPMRFGSAAADADAARRALEVHGASLVQRLQDVRGCDQMTIRLVTDPQKHGGAVEAVREPPLLSGTQYLQSRAARLVVPTELSGLASSLATLQRGQRIETGRHTGVIGTIYHLIPRGQSEPYRAAAHRAAAEITNAHAVISGPSPPYAFAQLDPV